MQNWGWLGFFVLVAACQGPSNGKSASDNDVGNSPETSVSPPKTDQPQILRISCHELLGGKPSPEATIYELSGRNFYSISPGGEPQLISTDGDLTHLSRTVDDEGPQDAYATHIAKVPVLTRTVLWQRSGQPRNIAFVEHYDFVHQTVRDNETGEDSCYHNAKPDGRTQEQAERDALDSMRETAR